MRHNSCRPFSYYVDSTQIAGLPVAGRRRIRLAAVCIVDYGCCRSARRRCKEFQRMHVAVVIDVEHCFSAAFHNRRVAAAAVAESFIVAVAAFALVS